MQINKHTHTRKERGFTLLEIAIVIAIMGLIVGAIVVGKEMVDNYRRQAIMRELNEYRTAVMSFRSKYNGLPGDLVNAVVFWGAAAGSSSNGVDATCQALDYTSPATGTETCNGNGNGQVSNSAGTDYRERYRFWQQLGNSGMISGFYTGVPYTSTATDHEPKINSPESKFGSGGSWSVNNIGSLSGNANLYDGNYENIFELRYNIGLASPYMIVSPFDMMLIDVKLDDGLPATGLVRPFKPNFQPNCASDATITATYRSDVTSPACSMIFINMF